jgi:hypothetical protein
LDFGFLHASIRYNKPAQQSTGMVHSAGIRTGRGVFSKKRY